MAKLRIVLDNASIPVSAYLDAIDILRLGLPAQIRRMFKDTTEEQIAEHVRTSYMSSSGGVQSVYTSRGTWSVDTLAEVFALMRQGYSQANFTISAAAASLRFNVMAYPTVASIEIVSSDNAEIEHWAGYWADVAEQHKLPEPEAERPRIFIGHGGSAQWRELSDYLHHQMHYEVEAFETLPRAGHTIKEVLDNALVNNNVAILVMTAEDEQADESMRARQNVVHETGLFQGRLGFHRTIVLLEEGTDDYSNLAGLQELRYPAGSIRATYGDIIATLQREFPA